MTNPFFIAREQESTIFATSKNNRIEIITKDTQEIKIHSGVRPNDYITETISVDLNQEEVNKAVNTDPIEYFKSAPMPYYRRMLELTLGINPSTAKKHSDELGNRDQMPITDPKEFYTGIRSVLTSLSYGLINNPFSYGMHLKKFFCYYGKTDAGRDIHYDIIKGLFPESVIKMESSKILGKKNKFNLCKLFNKRWVFIDEVDDRVLNDREQGQALRLTSGHTITVERRWLKSFISGDNYAVIYYQTNTLPPAENRIFFDRMHVDQWRHDFNNTNDDRNKENVSPSYIVEKEGKYIVLTLLSFLSELFKTKSIPVSASHKEIKKSLIKESPNILMRWYDRINPNESIGKGYISFKKIYNNFVVYCKIIEHPQRSWWENKIRRDMNISKKDTDFSIDRCELFRFIRYHNIRRKIKEEVDLIEFLYVCGHRNIYANEQLVVLFPSPLVDFEDFFNDAGSIKIK